MIRFLVVLISLLPISAFAQEPVHYLLEYYSGNDFVAVTIQIPEDAREKTNTLIIPRSAPGTYSLTRYSDFVEQVSATTGDGAVLDAEPGPGSF